MESGKPFIFISYSHENEDEVGAVVKRLKNAGYNVWYDEYLDVGGNFNDEIARQIKACSVFILFLSEAYLKSTYCSNEANYALNHKKAMFAVYLEEVSLDDHPGLEMRLTTSNNLFKYRMSMGSFMNKLVAADAIQCCLIGEKTETEPLPEPDDDEEDYDDAGNEDNDDDDEKEPEPLPDRPPPKVNAFNHILLIFVVLVCTISAVIRFIYPQESKVYFSVSFGVELLSSIVMLCLWLNKNPVEEYDLNKSSGLCHGVGYLIGIDLSALLLPVCRGKVGHQVGFGLGFSVIIFIVCVVVIGIASAHDDKHDSAIHLFTPDVCVTLLASNILVLFLYAGEYRWSALIYFILMGILIGIMWLVIVATDDAPLAPKISLFCASLLSFVCTLLFLFPGVFSFVKRASEAINGLLYA